MIKQRNMKENTIIGIEFGGHTNICPVLIFGDPFNLHILYFPDIPKNIEASNALPPTASSTHYPYTLSHKHQIPGLLPQCRTN